MKTAIETTIVQIIDLANAETAKITNGTKSVINHDALQAIGLLMGVASNTWASQRRWRFAATIQKSTIISPVIKKFLK